MTQPQKFKRIGRSYVGHAVAIKSNSGAEIIILCPTKEEAVRAAEAWGNVVIDRKEVKRAALGPVSQFSDSSPVGAERREP
jgi:hypothetical protein